MQIQVAESLKKTDLFAGLDKDELDLVGALCEAVQFAPGEEIFAEDSEGTELYVLLKGRVSVEIRIDHDHESESIYKVKANEIFGELALLDGFRRSARTRSMDDSVLLRIDRDALLELLRREPHIGFAVMSNFARILAQRLRDTNIQLRNTISQHRQMLNSLAFNFR